ncbi:hypothetical protein L3V43_00070 [Pseudoalteromonas sp. L23]|uniref:hypothetical protein n=1 Tax=unclassified Pseudoalteromonas TaxID=194690 RepID=UPI001EF11635|nr:MULTISPECIES: hypothetical protein [unclassified Pseudoalteromonas]MCF7512728.1 hypothetical protein [Pseudoalteromonas sp. L7]MCF7524058.1 hypothetical protein [Pseudoalteromonas sp. L23]MCX2769682.1 hypothetical protein [Pseudoalteromonas sp. B530]
MIKSPYGDVKKEAARQIYARWFFDDLFQEEIDLVINGENILKEGCASVIRQFLTEDKYHDIIDKVIIAYTAFLNCDSEDILKTVGSCVGAEHYWTKHNTRDLFEIFAQSSAAKHCLWELFNQLENQAGSITEYSDHLLKLVVNLTEGSKLKSLSIDYSSLIKVLQRLYDEATEDEDKAAVNICLDIWDRLLESDVFDAISAVKKLDKGLLG